MVEPKWNQSGTKVEPKKIGSHTLSLKTHKYAILKNAKKQ